MPKVHSVLRTVNCGKTIYARRMYREERGNPFRKPPEEGEGEGDGESEGETEIEIERRIILLLEYMPPRCVPQSNR